MKINIQLFAMARDLAGAGAIEIELPEEATVATLRQAIAAKCPPLADLVSRAAIAVNAEYAVDEQAVSSSDDVAIIPPVSGG